MKKEYDLKALRLKRRGPLAGLRGVSEKQAKVRVTIALDEDLVAHFKTAAARPGGLPYQTQINQALRRAVVVGAGDGAEATGTVKAALLSDEEFLSQLARRVAAGGQG